MTFEPKEVFPYLQLVVIPLVTYVARKVGQMRSDLSEIKTSVKLLDQWREEHSDADDARFRETDQNIRELRHHVWAKRALFILLTSGVIAVATARAWGQTATPTATSTPTPCENVEIENISIPPLSAPLAVRSGQDAIVVGHSIAAGGTSPLTVRFVNRRCESRGGDGDREGQVCYGDEDCPTLGVTVPYTCLKRLRAPETLDYSVVDVETGTVVTATSAVVPAERTMLFLSGAETRPLDDPPADTRFRRRVRLSWSFPCGTASRDVELTFRQVHASTPTHTATQTPTNTPTP